MKLLSVAALAALASVTALLSGCATTEGGVPIDTSYTSRGQDCRALFLVIHYTVSNLQQSLKILTEQEVSAHYLLTDEARPRIYRLVDENRRAWHSGASAWMENRRLNSSSIGIEIVHPGARTGPDGERIYLPFPQAQIDALIPLVRDIVRRHQIKPERILGHAEVSAQNKEDPGPTFPWRLFSQLGITPPWPDAVRVAAQQALFETTPPDIVWWQGALALHGFEVQRTGLLDRQTERVLSSFQMRYRPARYDGQPDAESAALLHVLTTPAGAPEAAPALPVPAPAAAAVLPR